MLCKVGLNQPVSQKKQEQIICKGNICYQRACLKLSRGILKKEETTQDIDTGTGVTAEKDLHVGVLTREVIVKVM